MDVNIRCVSVYHKSGQLLCGGMRNGLEPYLPREERSRAAKHAIMRWETRKMLFPFIGTGKYSFTEYEKVKRVAFPLNQSILLLITIENWVDHNVIIDKIKDTVYRNFN